MSELIEANEVLRVTIARESSGVKHFFICPEGVIITSPSGSATLTEKDLKALLTALGNSPRDGYSIGKRL